MEQKWTVVLASASPRRRELLRHILPEFQVQSADIDETPAAGETPESIVQRLASEKARNVALKTPSHAVLGSDTVVAIGTTVLGKPKNEKDFLGMMNRLSGTLHHVYTAVSLVHQGVTKVILVSTEVEFSQINEREARQYWNTGEPADKAGGYAIQGIGGQFVKNIHGSVSAVIGLPLYETKALLKGAGIVE